MQKHLVMVFFALIGCNFRFGGTELRASYLSSGHVTNPTFGGVTKKRGDIPVTACAGTALEHSREGGGFP